MSDGALFVLLMCLLGALVGAALTLTLGAYMAWVRRTKDPATVRLWRIPFMFVAIVALFLPPLLAGADSIVSSGADDDAYFLGFLASFLGIPLYRYLRHRR